MLQLHYAALCCSVHSSPRIPNIKTVRRFAAELQLGPTEVSQATAAWCISERYQFKRFLDSRARKDLTLNLICGLFLRRWFALRRKNLCKDNFRRNISTNLTCRTAKSAKSAKSLGSSSVQGHRVTWQGKKRKEACGIHILGSSYFCYFSPFGSNKFQHVTCSNMLKICWKYVPIFSMFQQFPTSCNGCNVALPKAPGFLGSLGGHLPPAPGETATKTRLDDSSAASSHVVTRRNIDSVTPIKHQLNTSHTSHTSPQRHTTRHDSSRLSTRQSWIMISEEQIESRLDSPARKGQFKINESQRQPKNWMTQNMKMSTKKITICRNGNNLHLECSTFKQTKGTSATHLGSLQPSSTLLRPLELIALED